MSTRRNLQGLSVGIILSGVVTAVAWAGPAQDRLGAGAWAPTGQVVSDPIVRPATRYDTSGPLRGMAPLQPQAGALRQIPRQVLPKAAGNPDKDPVVQSGPPSAEIPGASLSFEGINNVNGVLPPDTDGDVGPDHYVQMVNLSFAVWDRSGNLLMGPINSNTLWSGFGGPCQTTNDGDPIVLYDHLADRWILTQFALPNYPLGPFYECIAVSQTGDPTGAYHRYEFLISNTKMNDYPKFGVWPDAYYMSVNQFNQATLSWGGQGVVAFERSQMLSGLAANMVYFDLFPVDSNLGGMLPADLDGPVPPAGMPSPFAQIDDDAWDYSPDQLQIWQFDVDWGTPANSTFSHVVDLGTAAFDSNMCGYSRNCIPQPGGTAVDAISDRLMYRLQYRNFGTHQTLVTNHTVDADGSNRAGIRWYEARNSGGGWAIHQQGTFSPDTNHRWMGSIAMDGDGNIALGYSISSTSVFPSIRYTGRLAGDPLGTLPQGEGVIVAGGGSQSHSSGRWGDYSMMSVDPADDCTYWYTQEYYANNSAAGWRTRIGAFGLPGCSGIPTPTATATGPTPTPTGPTPTPTRTPTSGGKGTATPTRTPTPGGPSPTPSRTPTRTSTSGGGKGTSTTTPAGPSATPTSSPTPGGPTMTSTPSRTPTPTRPPKRTATPLSVQ